jgi:hypothetical protein
MLRLKQVQDKADTSYNNGTAFKEEGLAERAYHKYEEAYQLYLQAINIVQSDPDLKSIPTELLVARLSATETLCQLIYVSPANGTEEKQNEKYFIQLNHEFFGIQNQKQPTIEAYKNRIKNLETHILHKRYLTMWNKGISYFEAADKITNSNNINTNKAIAYFNFLEKGIDFLIRAANILDKPNFSQYKIHNYESLSVGPSDKEILSEVRKEILQYWDNYSGWLEEHHDNPEIAKKQYAIASQLIHFFNQHKIAPEYKLYFTCCNYLENLYRTEQTLAKRKDILTQFKGKIDQLNHRSNTMNSIQDQMELLSYQFFYYKETNSSLLIEVAENILKLQKQLSVKQKDPWLSLLLEASQLQTGHGTILEAVTQKKRKSTEPLMDLKPVPSDPSHKKNKLELKEVKHTLKKNVESIRLPQGDEGISMDMRSLSSPQGDEDISTDMKSPSSPRLFKPALTPPIIRMGKIFSKQQSSAAREALSKICCILAKAIPDLLKNHILGANTHTKIELYLYRMYRLAERLNTENNSAIAESKLLFDRHIKRITEKDPSYLKIINNWKIKVSDFTKATFVGRFEILFDFHIKPIEDLCGSSLKKQLMEIIDNKLNEWSKDNSQQYTQSVLRI